MMHKAWCNLEEVPYNFSRSSIKFQGHTGWKIVSKITRPVAAIKSLRFALFSKNPKSKYTIQFSKQKSVSHKHANIYTTDFD